MGSCQREAQDKIKQALADENPWKGYWGLIACSSFGEEANSVTPQIQDALFCFA